MANGSLQIDGRKFRVIPESEYQILLAAAAQQRRDTKQDALDLAQAKQRIKDPKRKTIPLAELKASLGL